ncbi:glycosyltransferase family 4 protein [Winogradskyella epiphytica]|nr:glycosyltransferase family 4 protein [Winogradskyella epiphytica]
MKIVIAINTSWNIYNFRLGLIKALQVQGYHVLAVAPNDEYVTLLESEGVECVPIDINSKGTSIKEDLGLIRSYYKLYKDIKPNLILSYTIKPNIYGNYAAKALGIPVINNVSGLGTLFIKKNLSTFIAYGLYKTAFLKSDWVFFQNTEDQNLFHTKKLINIKKTSIIPGSGVNTETFKVVRFNNHAKCILFVGRLIGDKGIREFIDAAKLLLNEFPDLKFKIVGELGYNNKTAVSEEELEEWLKISQIEYIGKVDNMKLVYEQSDIMVLPSYREGLSKSLIEACAMSLPIVTTNVPGCKDVVSDGFNGYLCKPKDAVDLADKIALLLNASEEKRLEIGRNARRIAVDKFDEKLVIASYLEKIKSLINN